MHQLYDHFMVPNQLTSATSHLSVLVQRTLFWLMATFLPTLCLTSISAQAQITSYTTTLSGSAEDMPNASTGTGSVTVTINTSLSTMRVQCAFSGLSGTTTAAHIHAPTRVANTGNASVATTTPNFIGFPSGVSSGTYDQTFNMLMTNSYGAGFLNVHGGSTVGAFLTLQAALNEEKSYFNIHTSLYPGGEIRGFLKPVNLMALSATSPAIDQPILVLSAGNCPVQFTGLGWGKSFVMEGPGGYVFSDVFRNFIVGGPIVATGINQPGTYTLTVYGEPGQTPVSYSVTVTGTPCK